MERQREEEQQANSGIIALQKKGIIKIDANSATFDTNAYFGLVKVTAHNNVWEFVFVF